MCIRDSNKFYSNRKDSTGLFVAAFQLCQLTVSSAIVNAIIPVRINIHQLSPALQAKFFNQPCMTYQPIGSAIIEATFICNIYKLNNLRIFSLLDCQVTSSFAFWRVSRSLTPLVFSLLIKKLALPIQMVSVIYG